MHIGIGLQIAVPGRPAREITRWAVEAERLGFHSLGSIDRLVYDVLDPLVSLGVAAAVTERARLFTTVLNVGWRGNPLLLAKQLATVDLISGGRLTVGLGLGGWPEDFAASGVPARGRGKLFDAALLDLRRAWDGEVKGAAGPMSLPGPGRPRILIGGTVEASYARAARVGDGWVAPLVSRDLLVNGIRGTTEAWAGANRPGRPQVLAARYFCVGDGAAATAAEYIAHYYGPPGSAYFEPVMADTLTTDEHLRTELDALAEAGVDDVLLYPCSSSPDQVPLLAEALERVGARRSPTFRFAGHPRAGR